ncbi:helix-turn-helix transcriptional regulator [Halomonas sp. WWR20]
MSAIRPVIEKRTYPPRVLTDRHAFHQLLLGLEGHVELEVAGRGVQVGAGVLVPIAAGDEHHYLAPGHNGCLALDLPVAWCETLELDIGNVSLPRRVPPLLLSQARQWVEASPIVLAGWLQMALSAPPARSASPRLRLIRLLPEVMADLARPWRVGEMAARCHLAEAAFARQFRALTGQTPHAWLTDQRLAQACRHMRDSCASLTEIALVCGFGDGAHFSRVFRRHHGCSPREWRGIHANPASVSRTYR